MKHTFELTDGTTTRQGYFKKVTMEDGLKIITTADGMTRQEETAVNKFVNIAIKYLVLVIPETYKNGFLTGHTDNYLKVEFKGCEELIGKEINVKLIKYEYKKIIGNIVKQNNIKKMLITH